MVSTALLVTCPTTTRTNNSPILSTETGVCGAADSSLILFRQGMAQWRDQQVQTRQELGSVMGVSLKQRKPPRLRWLLSTLAENPRNLRFCYLPQTPLACLVAIPSPTGCTSQLPLSFQRFVKVFKSSKLSASTTTNIRWLGWFIYAATTLTLSLPSIHRVCSA